MPLVYYDRGGVRVWE